MLSENLSYEIFALFWYFTQRRLVVTDVSGQRTLRNIPEEQRSHLHHGGNLNSRLLWYKSSLLSASPKSGTFEIFGIEEVMKYSTGWGCTNLGRLNFVGWHVIFRGLQYATSFMSHISGTKNRVHRLSKYEGNHLKILVWHDGSSMLRTELWRDLWPLLLSGAFCSVHVHRYTFLCQMGGKMQ